MDRDAQNWHARVLTEHYGLMPIGRPGLSPRPPALSSRLCKQAPVESFLFSSHHTIWHLHTS
jgi:hypothetical protein